MNIRLYGHILSPSGYGRACRELAMSLAEAPSVRELEIVPFESGSLKILEPSYLPLASRLRKPDDCCFEPDVAFVHTLPMSCSEVLLRTGILEHCPAIAYTTWEGCGPIPEAMIEELRPFEQIWTPSKASANGFLRAFNDDGVRVIPHAFDKDVMQLTTVDSPFDHRERFHFYYVGAWNSRKNVAGILRAWAMAFQPEDEVGLVLQCAGTPQESFAVALHQTGLSASEMAPVKFQNENVTDDMIRDMHLHYDCFVSAARGEAWNLPAFDAMVHGRHVIATGDLGSDDFLADTSAELIGGVEQPATVDVRVTSAVRGGLRIELVGAQGLSSRSPWVEPRLDHLAWAMRGTYHNKRRDLERRYDPAERYSYEAVGKLCQKALEDL